MFCLSFLFGEAGQTGTLCNTTMNHAVADVWNNTPQATTRSFGVTAEIAREDQIAIFKGFSSSLMRPTALTQRCQFCQIKQRFSRL